MDKTNHPIVTSGIGSEHMAFASESMSDFVKDGVVTEGESFLAADVYDVIVTYGVNTVHEIDSILGAGVDRVEAAFGTLAFVGLIEQKDGKAIVQSTLQAEV